MNIAEQIAAYEARRAAHVARMSEIIALSGEKGETLDTEQQEEFDTLQGEIEAIDGHLKRLRIVEQSEVASAKPVAGANPKAATASRSTSVSPIITVQRNVERGTAFTRYVMAIARSKGNLMQAAEIAQSWRDTTPEVEIVLRAAVAAGTTTDPEWAGALVPYRTMADEFIELLRPETIIGRIEGFRRVPFNVKMPAQLTPSSASWVGEAKPKPVSKLTFELITLGFAKAAGIVVLTEELVRFSDPSAEAVVRRDMIETIARFLDEQFIDPTVGPVPGVHPASITYGAAHIDATGSDPYSLRADVFALLGMFVGANMSLAGAYWIMSPVNALAIFMMQNPLGQQEFPGINQNGGVFFGLPVIVSMTAQNLIVLVQPRDILLADDRGVTIDISREASVQMDDAPTGNGVGLVSLWQQNMVGVRAERFINWAPRRPECAAYISDADYQPNLAGSPTVPEPGEPGGYAGLMPGLGVGGRPLAGVTPGTEEARRSRRTSQEDKDKDKS
ncbi:phage major capsid protein [Paraburkholderia adhaesiva]|uniref:phage major capsid protein n=1 Tax=Paraburkholderia adhaesiva TaxID=2883244 RepID=UPI001F195C61|nr:phage major capsid protein [Paraburkholderia adhaesiva]